MLFPNNEAHFRVLDDGSFNVSFNYFIRKLNVDKAFQFHRKLDEPIDKFSVRLLSKINELNCKKKKNKPEKVKDEVKNEGVEPDLSVDFFRDGTRISNDTCWRDVFKKTDNEITLNIGQSSYKVIVNLPWVQFVTLPSVIIAGFPVYPYKLDMLYSDIAESEFTWSNVDSRLSEGPENIADAGFVYVPSTNCIGNFLRLTCKPKKGNVDGPTVTVTSETAIDAGPGYCPFEDRHAFTKTILKDDAFRVVSYNILANLYATSADGLNTLFTYCPQYAMKMHYRKLLLLKEILGFNADIMCLQEVDCNIFERDLRPVFNNYNYDGVFTKKGGQVTEGVACFYRKNRLRLISNNSILLDEESQNEECLTEIWNAVKINENLTARMNSRNTVVQILVFEYIDKPNHKLIIGNTHLYFHPNADHIRLLHAGMALNLINDIKIKIQSENLETTVSTIFAGDFNSPPEWGVYHLFTKNSIPEDYEDWKKDDLEVDESVRNLSLYNPINFKSACGTPEFTTFTPHFVACIDYIFYDSDNFDVEQVIPFPSKEDVSVNTAIPSVVFPSDHVPLVTDLKWRI